MMGTLFVILLIICVVYVLADFGSMNTWFRIAGWLLFVLICVIDACVVGLLAGYAVFLLLGLLLLILSKS